MRNVLQQFLRREAHPLVQFIKYGMAGGLATVVDIVVFYALAWLVLPALTSDDQMVRLLNLSITPVTEAVRLRNYVFDRTITFLFSNFAAYAANVLWVFTPGRHSRTKEIALFYLVSGTSYLIGTGLSSFLIARGATTTTGYLVNMVSSLLINYVCRKFIVFKG
jgi:putative flippase GtrA